MNVSGVERLERYRPRSYEDIEVREWHLEGGETGRMWQYINAIYLSRNTDVAEYRVWEEGYRGSDV